MSAPPPVRVLYVLPSLRGGGAERVAIDVITGLAARGFRCEVLLFRPEGELIARLPAGVRWSAAFTAGDVWPRRAARLLWRAVAAARRADVVVGGFEGDAGVVAGIAGRLARRPVVNTIHNYVPRFTRSRRLRAALAARLATVNLVVSPALAAVTPGAVVCIPNPVDAVRVRALAASAPEPAPPRPRIIACGRLEAQKDFATLIRAHALLRRRGLDHDLVILGEGSHRAALLALVAALDVGASVRLPGWVDNPFGLVAASAALCLSSRFEGFSLVLAEALALGVPVVATDCPSGPSYVLEGGRLGRLVPVGDVEALAEALAGAIGSPPLPAEAVERALARFAPPLVITAYAELFHRLAARLAARRAEPRS